MNLSAADTRKLIAQLQLHLQNCTNDTNTNIQPVKTPINSVKNTPITHKQLRQLARLSIKKTYAL